KSMISDEEFEFLIVEDCPTYGPLAKKNIKKCFPNSNVELLCDYQSARAFIDETPKLDIIICDIALRETDIEDIKENLGRDLLFDLSLDRPNSILIAWTQLADDELTLSLKKRQISVIGKHLDIEGLLNLIKLLIKFLKNNKK